MARAGTLALARDCVARGPEANNNRGFTSRKVESVSDLDDLAAAAQGRTPPPRQFAHAPPQPRQVQLGTERIWTVHDGGNQYGPHTEQELATMLAGGTISRDALVWKEGSPRWIPLTNIVPMPPGLPGSPASTARHGSGAVIVNVTNTFGAQAPIQYAAPMYQGQSTNRILAGVFGMLLGALGIHKFILGYTSAGIIMLIVTIATCGYGGIVMGIIGFVEGIIYLTKSDAEFHRDYVISRKFWF
jgi:TM2 domain-containing membrane protein YozV